MIIGLPRALAVRPRAVAWREAAAGAAAAMDRTAAVGRATFSQDAVAGR